MSSEIGKTAVARAEEIKEMALSCFDVLKRAGEGEAVTMSADQVAFTTECVRQVATLSIRTALTRAATDRILGDAERFMSGVLREPVHLGATIDVPVVIR